MNENLINEDSIIKWVYYYDDCYGNEYLTRYLELTVKDMYDILEKDLKEGYCNQCIVLDYPYDIKTKIRNDVNNLIQKYGGYFVLGY